MRRATRNIRAPQFVRGVSLLLAAAVGVALVSRIAKNFQDYFVNVITQKVGARIYTDGVRHSLDLPYSLFEDQRSGSCSELEAMLRSLSRCS
jgi:ATP-binding cassette subfamily B protein